MILVSAGFNATEGHPNTLGGYTVTPACESTSSISAATLCPVYHKLSFSYRFWAINSHVDERREWEGGDGSRGRVRNLYTC